MSMDTFFITSFQVCLVNFYPIPIVYTIQIVTNLNLKKKKFHEEKCIKTSPLLNESGEIILQINFYNEVSDARLHSLALLLKHIGNVAVFPYISAVIAAAAVCRGGRICPFDPKARVVNPLRLIYRG